MEGKFKKIVNIHTVLKFWHKMVITKLIFMLVNFKHEHIYYHIYFLEGETKVQKKKKKVAQLVWLRG